MTQTRPGRDVQDTELQRVMESSKLDDGCLLRPREKVGAAAVEDAASSWARIDGLSPRMPPSGAGRESNSPMHKLQNRGREKFHEASKNFKSRSCCAATNVSGAKKVPPFPGPNEWRLACPPSRWARRRAAPWSRGRTRCGVHNFTRIMRTIGPLPRSFLPGILLGRQTQEKPISSCLET